MDKISFQVQGSESVPYEVAFIKEGSNLFCTCTCKAGMNNTHCKHRLRILLNDPEAIVSGNLNEVGIVASWLPGSQLAKAIMDYEEAEKEFEAASEYRKKALKVIGWAMNPR